MSISKPSRLPESIEKRIQHAVALIAAVPGYADAARQLERLREQGRIRYVPELEDRAHAGLTGTITLGPEPFASGATLLGLAETLVHEAYHLKQNPLLKTASFWTGVLTGTPVMRRYERPAYTAALRFLQAAATTFPERRQEAQQEIDAVKVTFFSAYEEELNG